LIGSSVLNLLDYDEYINERLNSLKNGFGFNDVYIYFRNTFKNQDMYSYSSNEFDIENKILNKYMTMIKDRKIELEKTDYSFHNFSYQIIDDPSLFIFNQSKFEIYILFKNTSKYNENAYGFLVFSVKKEKNVNDVKKHITNNHHLEIFLEELNNFKYQLINYNKVFDSIDQFTEILKIKYSYMPYHMNNVANLALEMASKLELNSIEKINIYFASIIHDVGKIYIPAEILNKEEKLTDEEFEVIKTHSEMSCQIATNIFSGIDVLEEVPKYTRYHHERFDGKGYPDGLKEDEIPYLSQIIGICDAVDAMRSNKPYAGAGTFENIVEELKRCSGTQFNPKLVPVMIDVLREVYDNKYYIDINILKYIPNTSLNYINKLTGQHHTILGNLNHFSSVIKFGFEDKNMIKEFDSLESIKDAKISYVYLENLYEYQVQLDRIENNQIEISNLIRIPSDQLFSVNWVTRGDLILEMKSVPVMIFRIGAKGLGFIVDSAVGNQILKHKIEIGNMRFKLEVDSMSEVFNVNIRMIRHYLFNDDYRFIAEYENIPENERDSLYKYLFKKQIKEKMIIEKRS
jgi:HD-GYP domain-containing protein (c-di-GMP phosphodiesterase class II)